VFIGDYGVEADVWAAGMMMYQLLSNRFPWWSTMEELHTTTLEEVSGACFSAQSCQRRLYLPRLVCGRGRCCSRPGLSLWRHVCV